MNAETMRAELAEAMDRVAAARRLLAAGYTVDLEGLDLEVGRICEAIAHLPRDGRNGLKGPLVALTDELDRLETDLRGQHETLSGQLKSISSGARAAQAYGKGGRTGNR